MYKQIGVIGDIHCQSKLLKIALEFLQKNNIKDILSVGDIIDGKGDVNKCFQLLQKYNVITVRGNHENWFLEERLRHLKHATQLIDLNLNYYEYINNLPATRELKTPLGLLLLCHGIGENDMAHLKPYDYGYAIESNFPLQDLINSRKYQFMINGHTHLRMVRKFDNLTIINGGSLKGKDEEKPCFLIVDFVDKIVNFYEFQEKEVILTETIALNSIKIN